MPEEVKEGAADEEGKEGDLLDEIIAQLMEEYTSKNGEEPTEEVVKQWIETIQEANLAASSSKGSKPVDLKEESPTAQEKEIVNRDDVMQTEDSAMSENNVLSAVEVADLFDLSWECLETARVIYRRVEEDLAKETQSKQTARGLKDLNDVHRELVAVHLRLGDHCMESGKATDAIREYRASLEAINAIDLLSSDSTESWIQRFRSIGQLQCSLANAFLFASAEKSTEPGIGSEQGTENLTQQDEPSVGKGSILSNSADSIFKRCNALNAYFEAIKALKLAAAVSVQAPGDMGRVQPESTFKQLESIGLDGFFTNVLTDPSVIVVEKKRVETLLKDVNEKLSRVDELCSTLKQEASSASNASSEESEIEALVKELRLKVEDVSIVLADYVSNNTKTNSTEAGDQTATTKTSSSSANKFETSQLNKTENESSEASAPNVLVVKKKRKADAGGAPVDKENIGNAEVNKKMKV